MRSFTLVELIIVVIIIGILVTYATPKFLVTQERALDKEAIANLKLIVAAEKIYKMETGNYFPAAGIEDAVDNINTNLKLFLNENKWNYLCDTSKTPPQATAQRKGRTWTLAYTSLADPTCSGTDCPK